MYYSNIWFVSDCMYLITYRIITIAVDYMLKIVKVQKKKYPTPTVTHE